MHSIHPYSTIGTVSVWPLTHERCTCTHRCTNLGNPGCNLHWTLFHFLFHFIWKLNLKCKENMGSCNSRGETTSQPLATTSVILQHNNHHITKQRGICVGGGVGWGGWGTWHSPMCGRKIVAFSPLPHSHFTWNVSSFMSKLPRSLWPLDFFLVPTYFLGPHLVTHWRTAMFSTCS